MLVVSLSSVNHIFWFHLGCSWWNATILAFKVRIFWGFTWQKTVFLCGQIKLDPSPDWSPLWDLIQIVIKCDQLVRGLKPKNRWNIFEFYSENCRLSLGNSHFGFLGKQKKFKYFGISLFFKNSDAWPRGELHSNSREQENIAFWKANRQTVSVLWNKAGAYLCFCHEATRSISTHP